MMPQLMFHARNDSGRNPTSSMGDFLLAADTRAWDISHMSSLKQIVQQRLKDTDQNPFEAARRAGLDRYFINDILLGKKQSVRGGNLEKLALALLCDPADLISSSARRPEARVTYSEIVGYAGADPEGRILFSEGQGTGAFAPAPLDASSDARAVLINGYSMPFFAENGSLVWFDRQTPRPRPEMLNQVVIVELATGEVLIKRLQKGTEPDRYNLASLSGPLRENERLKWAAEIISIIPPLHARRVIQQSFETA